MIISADVKATGKLHDGADTTYAAASGTALISFFKYKKPAFIYNKVFGSTIEIMFYGLGIGRYRYSTYVV
jgi:hypothetical protein